MTRTVTIDFVNNADVAWNLNVSRTDAEPCSSPVFICDFHLDQGETLNLPDSDPAVPLFPTNFWYVDFSAGPLYGQMLIDNPPIGYPYLTWINTYWDKGDGFQYVVENDRSINFSEGETNDTVHAGLVFRTTRNDDDSCGSSTKCFRMELLNEASTAVPEPTGGGLLAAALAAALAGRRLWTRGGFRR